MKKPRNRIAAALVVGFVSLAATAGDASAQAPAAADHAKKAQNAFDVQSWTAAIQEYQAAYQDDPKPEYLWGLAQAQRMSGDCAAAIKTYKAFKRNDAVTANQGTAAELQISKCENELERKQTEAARKPGDAAPAVVPGAVPGQAPAPAGTAAAPAPGPARAPEAPSGPKPFYADVLGDVLFVSGVAAAGIGTYFLLSGNSDMTNTTNAPTYRVYDSGVDDAASKQKIGGIVLAGGGVLIGLAVVRYLTMSTGPKSAESSVGLMVGPGRVGYVGRF